MHRTLIASLFALCPVVAPAATPDAAARLQGDARAVAAIERMVECFGGREIWTRARSLYVEYDGRRTEPAEPVVERAWRDLQQPFQRAEYEGQSFYTVFVLSPETNWISRDGDVTVFEHALHQQRIEEYPFDFYSSLHTLAVADPRIRLDWQEPDRVIVKTTDGRERGWWQTDTTGCLVKWGARASDGSLLEYVYGPMRAFGNVNFPAWGASTDGWWRWEYTAIDVSTEPLAVSFTLPATN